jgi:general secretion pathway protein F
VDWTRSEKGRPVWHAFLLRLPQVGGIVRRVAVARFSRTLSTMLTSGVTMLHALDIAKETLGNVILKDAIGDARDSIAEGESIALTLRKSGHFPPLMTHMVAVGERAGQLEQMLEQVAMTYEREVEMKLTKLTNMLEPLMLVVMGGAVAFVIFSILQPIMDMSQLGGM